MHDKTSPEFRIRRWEDDTVYVDDIPELLDDDMVMEEEFETDSEEDDD